MTNFTVPIPLTHNPSYPPRQAHDDDAGLDLPAVDNVYVKPGHTEKVNTGVRVNIPTGYVGYLHVRSSIGIKRNLSLANGTGIIDAGYTGEIIAALHNHGTQKVEAVHAGEYITQLVIHEIPKAVYYEAEHGELDGTDRGANGIGSTGR